MSEAPRDPKAWRAQLARRVARAGFAALLALAVAIPFLLAHCDPLIDGHGYIGDETMILALALNGALDGAQSYGTEPDGTPLRWPGWVPLVTAVYGPALVRADPVLRVETGRLVSRLLCIAGVLAWVVAALRVIGAGSGAPRRGAKALALGALASLMFLCFPQLVFVASFARNDSLGFLFTCLTLLTATAVVREPRAGAVALLVFVAGATFWGHFVALVFSGYVAAVALTLAALRARQASDLRTFWRSAGTGVLLGGAALALVALLLNAAVFTSGPSSVSQATLLAGVSERLAGGVRDLGGIASRAVRAWLAWREVPVVLGAVIAWACGERLRRAYAGAAADTGRMPGPLSLALAQLPLLAIVVGSLTATYTVHGTDRSLLHDAYRPLVLTAYLAGVLLSVQVQDWSSAARERAIFALVILVALGLTVAVGRPSPALVEWRGYQPFAHPLPRGADGSAGWQDELERRRANQVRQVHLRQLDEYLTQRRVAAMATFDPMLLLLRTRERAVYYFHFQVPPLARAEEVEEETTIARETLAARGVRLLAATPNGLDARTFSAPGQPLARLRECIRHNWDGTGGFECAAGRARLSLVQEFETGGRRRQYTYGFEPATPIRIYGVTSTR